MYSKILIPLENSSTDEVILSHVRKLAQLCNSEIILVHVADGFVARNQQRLNLQDSEEIEVDREYLVKRCAELTSEGFKTSYALEMGEPAVKLLEIAESANCDLIAMGTHGHRFISDLILGSVADKIRHNTNIPVLMIKEPKI